MSDLTLRGINGQKPQLSFQFFQNTGFLQNGTFGKNIQQNKQIYSYPTTLFLEMEQLYPFCWVFLPL
jgi:hypothetical protein